MSEEKVKDSGIILPQSPSKALHQSPRNLIVFSKPKVGKTSAFAQLPNWLILDLDKDGSDYVDCMALKADSVEKIAEIAKAIVTAGRPYAGIVVDTATALEEMCLPYAEVLYSRTSMGVNWFRKTTDGQLHPESGKKQYGSIVNLPNGAGYLYLREAFVKMLELIKTTAPRMILSCHVKDAILDKKGVEFSSLDLDLTGKLKRIASSQSDAVGYLYRKGNQNILSFATTDEIACGARPAHLRNAQIVLSEMKDGKLVTYWDKVYID